MYPISKACTVCAHTSDYVNVSRYGLFIWLWFRSVTRVDVTRCSYSWCHLTWTSYHIPPQHSSYYSYNAMWRHWCVRWHQMVWRPLNRLPPPHPPSDATAEVTVSSMCILPKTKHNEHMIGDSKTESQYDGLTTPDLK